MAPSPKLTTAFLLLLTLSVQSHARQFFSKIPSTNTIPKETTIPNTDQSPENQNQQNLPNNQDQQQEPNFLPQAQTGYGLYGHESGLNSPETTTDKVTYAPYVTPITSGSFVDDDNNNNNNNYYNNHAFEAEQSQNLGTNARFTETNNDGFRKSVTKGNINNGGGYRTAVSNDDSYNSGGRYRRTASNDGRNYYNGDGYEKAVNNDGGNYYNDNGYRNNVGRQGMSDTRFLENGRYFYDVENEQNYFQNRNQFLNNRVNLRNGNAYSTNAAGFYGNGNMNSYNQMNGQKYENQEEFEP